MKALWITGILFAFVMLVVPAMAITTVTLYAGQNIRVGQVMVNDDPSDPRIIFTTYPNWYMTETHLAVADKYTEIPQKNGNPIPGQFEYSTVHDPPTRSFTYYIDDSWWTTKTQFDVAAHAVVVSPDKRMMSVVSGTGTKVIEVNGIPSTGNAVAANEPTDTLYCSDYLTNDDAESMWDHAVENDLGYKTPVPDWIWNAPYPQNPITGDYVKFQDTFTIPGYPTKATIFITADNGYLVSVNGVSELKDGRRMSAQLGPGFPGTLREQVTSVPQDGDWGVASEGWQTVGGFEIAGLLVKGENTLDITAANEYMWDADGSELVPDFHLLDGLAILDPNPGDGISVCGNPAGLIYYLQIGYNAFDVPTETAWADGELFEGNNWATYIHYISSD